MNPVTLYTAIKAHLNTAIKAHLKEMRERLDFAASIARWHKPAPTQAISRKA